MQTETIESDDEYVYFVGDTWSSVVFAHKEHADREDNDCFICHDHEPMVGSSKWNCSACHTASDPENLCDQDDNHGCIMAQCDSCHGERVASCPTAPFVDCSGETGDAGCCLQCHEGGYLAASGILLDSPVEGVNYQTDTISNTTDSKGAFFYMKGEMVTFSIADLILGRTIGGPIRTIVDLVEGAVDAYDPTVTNICRFLITLDQDGNPDNGITLTQEIIAEVEGRNIDFEQGIDDFGNDPDVEALIASLNSLPGVFTANTPRSLCASEDAQAHLTATLISINFSPLVTFPGALQVSGSNGCNASGCHSQKISANGNYHIDESYSGGKLNSKPIYKHDTQNYWIHWNTAGEDDEWKLSPGTASDSYEHHYSWSETGGENTYPPLGAWPSGCFTDEGKQITAILSPLGGISGNIWVGEKLTGIYYYFDDEGDKEGGTIFQWYRCDDNMGTNDVMISGADSQTYTLVGEDENKYIRLGVTPEAASGNTQGEEIKSGPAGPVIVNGPPVATSVSISGQKYITAVLTGTYTYSDAVGDTEGGTTFKWYRYSNASGSGEEVIAGATSRTYTLQDNDEGRYIRFDVTPGASTGASPGASVKSSSFGPIDPDPLNQAPTSGIPVISGDGGCICVNSQLTAGYTYSDAENDPEGSSTYQWYIETGVGSGVYEAINGATSLTGTVADDCDEGKHVKFQVTPIAVTGNSPGATVESNPLQIQMDPDNQPPVVSNVYVQTPVYVESQAVGYYNYYDTDGNADASTFQWYVADTINGTYAVISGATSNIFIPPDGSYEGRYLKLSVTPHSECGNNASVVPVESSPVEINPSLGNAYPVVDNVSITGTVRVAETLTGTYTYSDADSDPDCSTLQWYYSAALAGTYTAISGATSEDYTPPDNGVYDGKYLKLCVTPISCSGNNYIDPPEVYSEAFGPLGSAVANQLPTADPEISGNVYVESAATGVSNYYDAEGAPETSTYAWYVCTNQDGSSCGSVVSTTTTYTPVTADIGKYLKFEVTPRSAWGNSPGVTVASDTKVVEFNPGNSVPTATIYSGIKVEGTLLVDMNDGENAYINELGAAGVDGVYQIADTVRYTVDIDTGEPCNPKFCDFEYSEEINMNGTLNSRVIYKHEDYYGDFDSYWIAWHTVPICRTAWWITDAVGRSAGGGAIAVGTQSNVGILEYNSYTPPLVDWGDGCGNGVGLSLYGGPYNKPGITGDPLVGNTLTGNYEYYDADGDVEGQSTFRWLRSSTVNGVYTPIPGATDISYVLTEEDEDMFLKFEVTPAAATGNSPGISSTSSYAGIGPVITPPDAYLVTGAEGDKTACNGTYYFRGYVDDPTSYYLGFAYWQKWNGSAYEDYYIFSEFLAGSLTCSDDSCLYYRSGNRYILFPSEGTWCETYDYYTDECGGDEISVTKQD